MRVAGKGAGSFDRINLINMIKEDKIKDHVNPVYPVHKSRDEIIKVRFETPTFSLIRSKNMKLAVTIDVEEEGLFSGRYDKYDAPVHNVSKLSLLDPLFREWGIRPTLFLSYKVAQHRPHHDLILSLQEKWKAEIGAHLHMWNTPPFVPINDPEPVSSEMIPREIMREKLETLLEEMIKMGKKPSSFRMGRFDMGPRLFSLLEEAEIRVDSSISPTRSEYGGGAYLRAPTNPYFPDPAKPWSPGDSTILEVPLTILPLLPATGRLLEGLWNRVPSSRHAVSWTSKYLFSLSAQPVAQGIGRLKTAVKLHARRGGDVVTIFFHSSELTPGISPIHPSDRHVEQFLEKLGVFLAWLRKEMHVESLTLSELYETTLKSLNT